MKNIIIFASLIESLSNALEIDDFETVKFIMEKVIPNLPEPQHSKFQSDVTEELKRLLVFMESLP